MYEQYKDPEKLKEMIASLRADIARLKPVEAEKPVEPVKPDDLILESIKSSGKFTIKISTLENSYFSNYTIQETYVSITITDPNHMQHVAYIDKIKHKGKNVLVFDETNEDKLPVFNGKKLTGITIDDQEYNSIMQYNSDAKQYITQKQDNVNVAKYIVTHDNCVSVCTIPPTRGRSDCKEILSLWEETDWTEKAFIRKYAVISAYGNIIEYAIPSNEIADVIQKLNDIVAPKRAAKEKLLEKEGMFIVSQFEKAKQTGFRQEISHYSVDCDEGECHCDIVTIWAMPDGTRSQTKSHTY